MNLTKFGSMDFVGLSKRCFIGHEPEGLLVHFFAKNANSDFWLGLHP